MALRGRGAAGGVGGSLREPDVRGLAISPARGEPGVRVTVEGPTITIEDDGVGLSEADAIENDSYEDIEASREPLWDIVATDLGYGLVEKRLGAQ